MTTTKGRLELKRFDPRQPGLAKVFGPLEAEIMQVVWRRRQATVAEVHDELQHCGDRQRDIAYTTVMTTMSRLAEKNVLRRERPAGQVSFVYSPALAREDFVNTVVKSVMDSLVDEFGEPVFSYLLSYVAASDPAHREVLAQALAAPPH